MNKEWNIKLNGEGLTTSEIIFNIMANRGIKDITKFLTPTVNDLIPHKALKNIEKAKDIILNTIKENGKFLIYADVDLDGCCSAAIMYRYLKHFTQNIDVIINSEKEHGISKDFDINSLNGVHTLIIVDAINDTQDEYRKILETGTNLIVIDHHVPSEEVLLIAEEICLVSSAVDYPNPHLSGSGVTWKVVNYIDSCTENSYSFALSDLAASGIIGDVCDVGVNSPENRYICYIGLNNITNPALLQIVGNYEFNSTSVSYSIAPLINSANRMGHNREALDLFLSDDISVITPIIERLKEYKEKQKQIINEMYENIIVPQSKTQLNNKCLYFLITENKNFGGVVAGKAADEFGRPVIILSESPDKSSFSGSMRAVGISDFRKIVNDSGHATCQGHELSAGVTMKVDDFFVVYSYIENQLKDVTFTQQIDVDVVLKESQINSTLIKQLKQINKISGQGFKPIQVGVSDISEYKITKMSSGKHLNIKAPNDISIIKWNMTDWGTIEEGKKVSAVGTLDENLFRGKVSKQLIVTDLKCQ